VAKKASPEARADEYWQRILRSPLASAYTTELYWLARNTVDACEVIFADAPTPPDAASSYIKVDHDLPAKVHQVVNNAARIRALVTTDRPRTSQHSAGQYAIQQARTRWLKDSLAAVPLSETLRAGVRHTLEHFDEYLDKTALKFSKQPPTGRVLLPLDVALGRESTLDQFSEGGTVYPLRVYLAEERTFVNCGKRVDIGAIHIECSALVSFLAAEVPALAEQDSGEGRGALMFVLTPDTFDT
jgi:hypothetical protein